MMSALLALQARAFGPREVEHSILKRDRPAQAPITRRGSAIRQSCSSETGLTRTETRAERSVGRSAGHSRAYGDSVLCAVIGGTTAHRQLVSARTTAKTRLRSGGRGKYVEAPPIAQEREAKRIEPRH